MSLQPATPPAQPESEAASEAPAEAATRGESGPVTTARSGAIGASVWANTTQSGKEVFGITLSRAWKSQDGEKSGYSPTFYASNRDDLHRAIDSACDQAQAIERATARRIDQLQSDVGQ
ncbi:hypothetical protein OAS39_08340 [Pirellulales bacterium]|nr:hypothetical protein [Pirellulales bacterium]